MVMSESEWSILAVSATVPGRVALGRVGSGLFAAEPLRPVLVLGPQRSRKTTGVVIPTLLEWPGAAVVTSVRRDIVDASIALRSRCGDVIVFEPLARTEGDSFRSGWNPLSNSRDWAGAVTLAKGLTEAGRLSLREGEFWHGLASQLLAPLLFAAATNGYTMSDVVRWVKTSEDFEVRALLQASAVEAAIEAFEGVIGREPRIRDSIYGTLMSTLSVYDDPIALESAVSGRLDPDRFLDGRPNTVYLVSPPDRQEELAPIFTGLIRQILRRAYELEALGSQQQRNLLVLLDEGGNIAPLDNLDTLATTAAGTGIQLVSVFHDISQMIGVYGTYAAQTICNNHSAIVVLPGNRDPETGRILAGLLEGEEVSGWVRSGSSTETAVRRLNRGTALCIYEDLPPIVLTLRSSSHDAEFQED